MRVADPSKFLKTIVGTDGDFQIDEIVGQLKKTLVSRFTTALGQANVPALDLAANYETIGQKMLPTIQSDFDDLGLTVVKFLIENISLPPEVVEDPR